MGFNSSFFLFFIGGDKIVYMEKKKKKSLFLTGNVFISFDRFFCEESSTAPLCKIQSLDLEEGLKEDLEEKR